MTISGVGDGTLECVLCHHVGQGQVVELNIPLYFWIIHNGIHVHLKDVMLQCKIPPFFFIGKCFLLMYICSPSQSFLLSKHGCRKSFLELSINCVMVTSDKFEWSKMGEDSASLDVYFLFFGDIFSSSFSLRKITLIFYNYVLQLGIFYFLVLFNTENKKRR